MANFVEIFNAGFPRIYKNAKSPENTCLKDFCILSLFVTWSNALSENESYQKEVSNKNSSKRRGHQLKTFESRAKSFFGSLDWKQLIARFYY